MKKRWLWAGLAAVVLLGVLIWLFAPDAAVPKVKDRAVLRAQHGYPSTPEVLQQAAVAAKIERRAQGHAKPSGPDHFFRYHEEIRARLDDPTRQYPPNYRMEALQAAQAASKRGGRWVDRQLGWQERGPGNVSGRTRGLVVDVRDPSGDTWYAASVGGGIWKTEDAGRSWRNLTPDLPNLATVTLAQCTARPEVLYVGTGEGFFNIDAVRGDGIWKSTDGGETWAQLTATANSPDFRTVNRLIVDPSNADFVIAATNAGLYRTTDGGATWAQVYPSAKPVQQVVAIPGAFNVQFATEYQGGVLRSYDAGQTWEQVFTWCEHYFGCDRPPNGIEGRMEVAVAPNQTLKVYLAIDHVNSSELWVSNNRGVTWQPVVEASGAETDWMTGQGWYNNSLTVHPFDSRSVYVGGVNLWHVDVAGSDDKRTTTELTNWYEGRLNPEHPSGFFPFVHADHHGLFVVPLDEKQETFRLINTNDGGVEYSDDGGVTWQKTLTGYNTAQFYGVDKRPGADAFIGGMQDNGTWRSPDGVATKETTPWLNQLGGDGFSVAWHAEDPQKIMGTIQFNDFWRTLDGGQTWASAINGLQAVDGFFITTLAKSQSDPEVLITTAPSGVWRTDTFGQRWSPAVMEDADRWYTFGARAPAALSVADPQVVWAGARMTAAHALFVSTDGGLSFAPVAQAEGVSATISGLATHPTDAKTAYALFSAADAPKVLRTTDLGQTWENLSGTFEPGAALSSNGFPNVATYALLVLPFNPEVLWAGTEIGLFVSEDGGQTWQAADNGLPSVSIWQLTIVDDQVIAATHGRGVWSVRLPELASYAPPVVTRTPRFNDLFFDPSSTLGLDIDVRSDYDSLDVLLDGALLTQVAAPRDTLLRIPLAVERPTTRSIQLVAYRGGRAFRSAMEQVDVFPVAAPQVRFSSTFSSASTDFLGEDFSVDTTPDFPDSAVHSWHPHPNRFTAVYQLRVPIKIAESEALLSYRDVAIIEPGAPGAVFGEPEFWDYVVVEGSRNGVDWLPLAPGYDADFDPRWRAVYDAEDAPDESLFVQHIIDLHDTFRPGEVIFLRFRLFADAAVSGWGWVFDDLQVQPDAPVATDDVHPGQDVALLPTYPNPFVAETIIPYRLAAAGAVRLEIFDLQGRRVRTLLEANLPPGEHRVRWDGQSDAGRAVASGVYLVRLKTETSTQTRQLVRVR